MTATVVPAAPDVGLRVIDGVADTVTVKVALTFADPLVVLTVWASVVEGDGTEKIAEKAPAALVVTIDGLVVC